MDPRGSQPQAAETSKYQLPEPRPRLQGAISGRSLVQYDFPDPSPQLSEPRHPELVLPPLEQLTKKRNPKGKPYPCQDCLRCFSSTHQLDQHVRTVHQGEKKYKCTFCDKRFKQLSHVQQHTRLHTGERPYKCRVPDCGRSFVQLSNLQQHMKTHGSSIERRKDRPYHCVHCGKSYTTESSLRIHKDKKHSSESAPMPDDDPDPLAAAPNNMSISCPVCQHLCSSTDELASHLRRDHRPDHLVSQPVFPGRVPHLSPPPSPFLSWHPPPQTSKP